MSFIRTWLIPRIAFWLLWTAWLFYLHAYLLDRWNTPHTTLLLVLGPPLLVTWIGSRFARNPYDTPSGLFWKGAAVSCLLGVFANIFLMNVVDDGLEVLFVALLVCGYMAIRGSGVKRLTVKQGDLFERAQAIARQTGVSVGSVVVFTSPRNTPSAFAHRMGGAIMLSDSLLRLLARQETDAVIAHEAAHLRPVQRTALALIPMIAIPTVFVHLAWQGVIHSAPFWPLLFILLWRAIRRMMEYDADRTAIRITRDPESLITGLTRVSNAAGLPLRWGRVAGLFMAHPPMTARFRAIARRAGISASRVDELMANATAIPALPGYDSPFAQPAPIDSAVLASHRARLQKRMAFLSYGFPIAAGIAAAAIAILWSPDFGALLALSAGLILLAVAIYCVAYEILVGLERRRIRRKLPEAGGYFAGLSTAAEPRTFDGIYHYDLGTVRIDGGFLAFQGLRCSFSLKASDVRRVWLANGPPHWTPRKVVCVEYENGVEGASVVSLQSLERWFWPGTSRAANQLLQVVTTWFKSGVTTDLPTVLPPQITGTAVTQVPLAAVLKPMKISCAVSLAGSWLIESFALMKIGSQVELLLPLLAPVVTASLILFALSPHLRRGQPPSPGLARPQPD